MNSGDPFLHIHLALNLFGNMLKQTNKKDEFLNWITQSQATPLTFYKWKPFCSF